LTVDWAGYALFTPLYSGAPAELSWQEARAAFDHLLDARRERIGELEGLLARNGVPSSYADGAPALQPVNDWLRLNIEPLPDRADELAPRWYSVLVDVALWLGEELIRRNPTLRWKMVDRPRRDASFQRAVLAGFRREPWPSYYVDIERLLSVYAHRLVDPVDGDSEPFDYFEELIETVGRDA
jgi:hypothetical protein